MSTPTEFFNFEKDVLSCQGISISEIVKETGTPVYIYCAEAFLKPLHTLQQGLAGLDYLICFAQKANSNLAILRLLANHGAGMDVVSGGELFRAQQVGVAPDRVVFSGVGKTSQEMTEALQYGPNGIFSFNIESLAELRKLSKVACALKKKARVALRFNPDVDPKTHPYISTGLKKNKFGLEKSEIFEIIDRLSDFPGIELAGISIHIGSQLVSLSPLKDAFSKLVLLIEKISPLLPQPLRFVDLGGGIGIPYKGEKAPSLEAYTKLVKKSFPSLKIILEPGRALSGNSGILVTEVLYRKPRSKKDFLVVDAGMNDLLRPALYQSYHGILPLNESKLKGKSKNTSLVGPVCESADCFDSSRMLSESLSEGDLIAFLSAGAYGFSMASNYNSRPRPAEVLVHQGKYRIIRQRETYEDLIRNEVPL